MILSERTTLTAFAEVGCPDDAAELNPLLDEIAAVCGVEDD
jgi:hypothetical protein